MKVTWKHGDRSIEFERQPMPPERFAAVCKLAGAVIGGVVLLVAVHEVGMWAAVLALVGLALVGLGKLMVWLCKSVE